MIYKKLLIPVAIYFALSLPIFSAPIFYSFGGEKVIKVMDFPDTANFNSQEGHFDLGYRYKQIKVFFIPVWNYSGVWCGYLNKEDIYLQVEEPELRKLSQAANLKFPDSASIPIWDAWGGKIIILLLIAVYLFWKYNPIFNKSE